MEILNIALIRPAQGKGNAHAKEFQFRVSRKPKKRIVKRKSTW
jgi:hypothetical protein